MSENTSQFTLLSDQVSSEDLYPEQTHKKIASTLKNIIATTPQGQTVSLEGGWGTGKSTIVEICRKLMENDPSVNTHFFYFDAWQHAGDPLRRIFLELFADKCIESELTNSIDKEELIRIKSIVSNRTKYLKTTTKTTATGLGKILSIATLLVPIGISLARGIDYSKLTFDTSLPVHWHAIISFTCLFAPILVLLINLIKCLIRYKTDIKKIFAVKNWAFLSSEGGKTEEQEVYGEERSTVEFEKYFNELLELIVHKTPDLKTIIVIDNLDRVEPQEALKIWSTLQTFIANKKTTCSTISCLNNLWVVIPCDIRSLSKLWAKEIDPTESKPQTNSSIGQRALSFFNKSFQIRIEVPKPIPSNWKDFFFKQLTKSQLTCENNIGNRLYEILMLSFNDLSAPPTPREINTYLNHIAIIRNYAESDISTECIAYYVQARYLKGETPNSIRNGLVAGIFPEETFKKNISLPVSDIAGLSFGVNSKKGLELLFENELKLAFEDDTGDKISILEQTHNDIFWEMLRWYFTNHKIEVFHSDAVYTGLHYELEQCEFLLKKLQSLKIHFDPSYDISSWLNYGKLLLATGYSSSRLWDKFAHAFEEDIISIHQEENSKRKDLLMDVGSNFKYLIDIFSNYNIQPVTLNKLNLITWTLWSQVTNILDSKAYKWIVPNSNNLNSDVEIYKTSTYYLFDYLYKSNTQIPDKLIDTSVKAFQDTSFFKSNQEGHYKNMMTLIAMNLVDQERVNSILSTPIKETHFWAQIQIHIANNSEISKKYINNIILLLHLNKFKSIPCSTNNDTQHINNLLNSAISNPNIAEDYDVLELINTYGNSTILTETLLETETNWFRALFIQTINHQNETSLFFQYENILEDFKKVNDVLEQSKKYNDDIRKKYIDLLLQSLTTKDDRNIITESTDIVTLAEALSHFADRNAFSENDQFILQNKISQLETAYLKEDLKSGFLWSLIIQTQKDYSLRENAYNALKQAATENGYWDLLDNYAKDQWGKFIKLLKPKLAELYSETVEAKIANGQINLNLSFIESHKKVLAIAKEDTIKSLIRFIDQEEKALPHITDMLSNQSNIQIPTDSTISSMLETKLSEFNDGNKQIQINQLTQLSEILGINLNKSSEDIHTNTL